MTRFDPHAYGPVFAPLLEVNRRRPLGDGRLSAKARLAIESLSVKSAFAHAVRSVADRDMASCCIAGLWLLYDELDASHTITQSIKSESGSFWHAIMHRREGDFSNSKYWFRRVGEHPVFDSLATRASEAATAAGQGDVVAALVRGGAWDPFAFVDLCQKAQRTGGPLADVCIDIQQAEWELLFDHCYRAAVGR